MQKFSKKERFPWPELFSISLGMLAHSVMFTSPLPYVAFMIVDFKMAKSTDSAGYYAGLITGLFMLGRTGSGIPWGLLSDQWGRRCCMIWSMVNVGIFGLCFGFSKNFAMAAVFRLMLGLGNGYMGSAKTCISELVGNKEHELRAFGYCNSVWGIGYIIGPALGGLLSRPVIQYPSVFNKGTVWDEFPYVIPAIACSAIAFSAAICVAIFVPETLHTEKSLTVPSLQLDPSCMRDESIEQEEQEGCDSFGIRPVSPVPLAHTVRNGTVAHMQLHKPTNGVVPFDVEKQSFQESSSLLRSANGKLYHSIPRRQEGTSAQGVARGGEGAPSSLQAILSNKQLLTIVAIHMVLSFASIFVDEVFPLWCVTSLQNGGLAWKTGEVGAVLAAIGVVLVVYQLFLFEPLVTYCCSQCTLKNQFVGFVFAFSVAITCVPLVVLIAQSLFPAHTPRESRTNLPLFVFTSAIFCAYHISMGSSFSMFSMVVNRSVTKDMRGTMNGVIMTAGSIGNGCGPIAGSVLYASIVDLHASLLHEYHASNSHVASWQEFVLVCTSGQVIFVIGGIIALLLAVGAKITLKNPPPHS